LKNIININYIQNKMHIFKRDGRKEDVCEAKIFKRIEWLANNPTELPGVSVFQLTALVINGLIDGTTTTEIDNFTASTAASLCTKHRDYIELAKRIVVNNHQKNTSSCFSDKISSLYLYKDKNNKSSPIISKSFNKFVEIHKNKINDKIDYDRDYKYDYFGFKTLQNGYLLTINKKIVERPQDLIMRVAIQMYMPTEVSEFRDTSYLENIFHCYDMISCGFYTPATPTLFNSGTPKPSLSSCFLLGSSDSLNGILKTLHICCTISKGSGGIGLHLDMLRCRGSYIRGTNGYSDGIIPQLRIFNNAARAYNQGGGKRKGSWVVYLSPHHGDIMEFLTVRLNDGADEESKCRDLFIGVWIPDLFMKRLSNGEDWSTFCPDECPGLSDVWGDDYEKLYLKYESEGKSNHVYKPIDIWKAIYQSQKDSGIPYVLYKDNVNRCNMQNNLGTIKSSNLCVSGDTLILMDKGYFPIKELSQCEPPVHNVWNGDIFTPATFAKTGVDQELLEIETTHGNIIKCTPYHKFILTDGDKKEKIVEAKDLKNDDSLISYKLPSGIESGRIIESNKIKSITKLETKEDTYCFKEPLKNRGIFNGLMLGNCSEIVEYSDDKVTASCNLSSICLPIFVEDVYSVEEMELHEDERRVLNHEFPVHPKFNYKKLAEVAGEVTENLNNVIDTTYNPIIESAEGNFRHRPLGIGIQGLADVFLKFNIAFDSNKAFDLNKKIHETIYYGALSKSTEICKKIYRNVIANFDKTSDPTLYIHSNEAMAQYPELQIENLLDKYSNKSDIPKTIGTYPSYLINGGSHMSNGKFHWEMFGLEEKDLSGMFDWDTLRSHIKIYGVRNSLLVALMPTGTTSQIMGNSSCFEPYVSNAYRKTTLAGSFIVINKYLVKYLTDAGIYNATLADYLLHTDGSIQNIDGIPQHIKDIYKTTYELNQKTIVQMAIDRQPFVDQSQSMNVWFNEYTFEKFNSMQFYGWKNGIKTGSYYIRTRPAATAEKYTISADIKDRLSLSDIIQHQKENEPVVDDDETICLMCSS
jgi:ribonucleotide reductase alpha subunit